MREVSMMFNFVKLTLSPVQFAIIGKLMTELYERGINVLNVLMNDSPKVISGEKFSAVTISLKMFPTGMFICEPGANGWVTTGFPWSNIVTPVSTETLINWFITNAKKNDKCYVTVGGEECPIMLSETGETWIKFNGVLRPYSSAIWGRLKFKGN